MSVCSVLYQLLRALLTPRLSLVIENLDLRQQLLVAGIEHRHAAVGFFPLLKDYPA
jgi:hypothetical protein